MKYTVIDSPKREWHLIDDDCAVVGVFEDKALAERTAAASELLEALRPFAFLARVMEEGQVLNFRGVYVTWQQAQAAADAIAKAEETA